MTWATEVLDRLISLAGDIDTINSNISAINLNISALDVNISSVTLNISDLSNNMSSQIITHLVSYNGTARGNESIINNVYMIGAGALGISIVDLGTASKVGVVRNDTLAYLNDGAALDANAVYGYDIYVNESDKINIQTNTSTDVSLDLYFRRT